MNVPKDEEKDHYWDITVPKLKKKMKEMGLKFKSNCNKDKLLRILEQHLGFKNSIERNLTQYLEQSCQTKQSLINFGELFGIEFKEALTKDKIVKHLVGQQNLIKEQWFLIPRAGSVMIQGKHLEALEEEICYVRHKEIFAQFGEIYPLIRKGDLIKINNQVLGAYIQLTSVQNAESRYTLNLRLVRNITQLDYLEPSEVAKFNSGPTFSFSLFLDIAPRNLFYSANPSRLPSLKVTCHCGQCRLEGPAPFCFCDNCLQTGYNERHGILWNDFHPNLDLIDFIDRVKIRERAKLTTYLIPELAGVVEDYI